MARPSHPFHEQAKAAKMGTVRVSRHVDTLESIMHPIFLGPRGMWQLELSYNPRSKWWSSRASVFGPGDRFKGYLRFEAARAYVSGHERAIGQVTGNTTMPFLDPNITRP